MSSIYWIIWYKRYWYYTSADGKRVVDFTETNVGDQDVVREEETNLIALFTKKEIAEEKANILNNEFRTTQVIPLELSYIDKNYFIIVDK